MKLDFRLVAPALAALAVAGCSGHKEADAEAKRRLFSPEEPKEPPLVPLDAAELEAPANAARAVRMSGRELAQRLGAFKLSSQVSFSWTRGGVTVAETEERTIEQARGGDFHARLENDKGRGLEFLWTGGGAYLKPRFGTFRKRRTDRTPIEHFREEATAALRSADELFDGALKLRNAGPAEAAGRRAIRYEISLGEPRPKPPAPPGVPPIQYPQGQPDDSLKRRLEFEAQRKPRSASGELLADAETGAVLAATFHGTLAVAPGASVPAVLTLDVKSAVSAVGKDPKLAAPRWEPDPETPHAVKDPLKFWTGGVAKPGLPGPPGVPGPDDAPDEDESPAPAAAHGVKAEKAPPKAEKGKAAPDDADEPEADPP